MNSNDDYWARMDAGMKRLQETTKQLEKEGINRYINPFGGS